MAAARASQVWGALVPAWLDGLSIDADARSLPQHAQVYLAFRLPADALGGRAHRLLVRHNQNRFAARTQDPIHFAHRFSIKRHNLLRRAKLLAEGRIAEDAIDR